MINFKNCCLDLIDVLFHGSFADPLQKAKRNTIKTITGKKLHENANFTRIFVYLKKKIPVSWMFPDFL